MATEGKEGKKDGRCGGWHWQTGEGVRRCVNWQQADGWKVQGGDCARCVGLVKQSIMGCRLMVIVVVFSGPMITCGFSSVPQSHKEALERVGTWQEPHCSITNRDLGTLSLEEGNVSKPYTTQFTLAPLWKPRLLYA